MKILGTLTRVTGKLRLAKDCNSFWLIRRSGEVCLAGLMAEIIAESSEPMVLGYSCTFLPKDAKDGADTSTLDGRSEML